MSTGSAFSLFHTAVGDCALAWNALGLTGVWLPDESAARLRARIARRHPDMAERDAEGEAAPAIDAIVSVLAGDRRDLAFLRIDDSLLDPFDRRVYAAARRIPPGRALTYAALALAIGDDPNAARAVGRSLGRNPFPIVVPCHRIVGAHGGLGGFSAPGGAATKRLLLTIENARLAGPADLFDMLPGDAP